MKVCFTGKRPKDLFGYYDKKKYKDMIFDLSVICSDQILYHNANEFITGGAQGTDQLAFWTINKLKNRFPEIKNTVYLPFSGQETKWSQEGMFSRKEYRQMLSYADKIVTIGKDKNTGYFLRNKAMVDNSDLVIVVATKDNISGGTKYTYDYAVSKNKDILLYDPFDRLCKNSKVK